MALDGTLPRYWDMIPESFSAANNAVAKILIEVSPPRVMPAIAGETALPGEPSVRQRLLDGGCVVRDGQITSTDAVARSMILWMGKQTTVYANMGVSTITNSVNATISRTVGSFVTDGYTIGSNIMLFGAASLTAANDGKLAQITDVTAGLLTLSGVSAISVSGTQGAGFRIIKVAQATRIPIPANSGNTDAILPVKLFGHVNDARLDTNVIMGENDMIMVSLASTMSAASAINVTVHRGLY